MGLTLSNSWNFATAMGELMSSLFLVFSIMSLFAVFKYHNKNDSNKISLVVQSSIFAIAGIVSMFLGKAFGNILSAHGNINGDQSLGLATPLFALITSFSFGIFTALPMMIGFQAIGSLIGALMYLGVSYAFKQNKNDFDWTSGLVINNRTIKQTVSTEVIAQVLLSLVVILISSINQEIIGSNVFTNSFVLLLGLFVVLFLFSSTGFFILSPFIELYSLIIGTFAKKVSKENWINFGIATAIHIGVGMMLGGIEYQVRYK